MEFSKRKYTRRFTYSEKLAFLDVVVRHVGVIERRTKDKDTSRLKREAWAKIDEEFAAASGVRDRESVSLRTLWENLKRMAKSKTANGLNGAEGSNENNFSVNTITNRVIRLLQPPVQLLREQSGDNANITMYQSISDTTDFNGTLIVKLKKIVPATCTITEPDELQFNPAMLESPIHADPRQPPAPSSQQLLPFTSGQTANTNTAEEMQLTDAVSLKVEDAMVKVEGSPEQGERDSENCMFGRQPDMVGSASETVLNSILSSVDASSAYSMYRNQIKMEILLVKQQRMAVKVHRHEIKSESHEIIRQINKLRSQNRSVIQNTF